MTPRGIHIFEHDGIHGCAGTETARGRKIQSVASKYERDPKKAEQWLLKKFNWWGMGNRYIAFVEFAEGDADLVLQKGMKLAGAGNDGDE